MKASGVPVGPFVNFASDGNRTLQNAVHRSLEQEYAESFRSSHESKRPDGACQTDPQEKTFD
jgi:hypothetical protein